MDGIARLPGSDRRALFMETAEHSGLSALIIEKDFWVCWTLDKLYGIEGMPRLLFKGGTSLSKCFQLIERFSEDIDLGLNRQDIGLRADALPAITRGSSSQKKARKRLREGAQQFVETHFIPMVRAEFENALTDAFVFHAVPNETESIVEFHYPKSLRSPTDGQTGYVSSVVRLELGARSDHYAALKAEVAPYVGDHFPDFLQKRTSQVTAQAPERTLLEKALILHTNIARGRVTPRSSRHAYDLAMMYRAGTMKHISRELFLQVAEHKFVFSGDRHAGRAPHDGIRVLPEPELHRDLEADYRNMQEMFFRTPPRFSEILDDLRSLEIAINGLE